jgi:hypothetical protein
MPLEFLTHRKTLSLQSPTIRSDLRSRTAIAGIGGTTKAPALCSRRHRREETKMLHRRSSTNLFILAAGIWVPSILSLGSLLTANSLKARP